MVDLYSDDIEDRLFSDEIIVAEVDALIKSGQREGTSIDYKSDVSELDNWPQTVAAFANSFGGLILFGVEGKNDQPRRLAGFDPKGVEIKTKLTSMVIDRIQPRPDFSVRVVTLDKLTGREIALLRVSEGRNPPYMHSKDQEHRIYVRVGAQKTEADYLQLTSLFEKRRQTALSAGVSPDQAFDASSQLFVPRPVHSNQVSRESVQFVLSPVGGTVGLRLRMETEHRFRQCIADIVSTEIAPAPLRSRNATVFRVSCSAYQEQRFGLSSTGAVGFVSYPGITTQDGLKFVPEHFCEYLLQFLSVGSLFYQREARYYGPLRLYVSTTIPGGAQLFDGAVGSSGAIGGAYLFDPPLKCISQYVQSTFEVSMHPVRVGSLRECLEIVLTDIARPHGSVLITAFGTSMKELLEGTVTRLVSANNT